MQVTFSGHETFPFRYGWLKKGVDAALKDPFFFSSDRAMVVLGVGKNMVQSIKYWGIATGLLASHKSSSKRIEYTPTDLAMELFSNDGLDPYLEDPATLWLIHWQLASNLAKATTWYFLFNNWHSIEFTKEDLYQGLISWLEQNQGTVPSESLVRRDIDCCLRTYTHSHQSKGTVSEESFDCPLSELSLISPLRDGRTFRFLRGEQRTLPNELLVSALTDYWNRYHGGLNSVALEKIAFDPGSPGRIFKLDPESLAHRLDQLSQISNGTFSYQESAGLKQVFRHREEPGRIWLQKCYLGS